MKELPDRDELPRSQSVRLLITAGPQMGKEFVFHHRETFLVGRDPDAHFRLSDNDPYFSRRHFLVEINPPRCWVYDLQSRNGTRVNGQLIETAELRDGDEIMAGHTVFRVSLPPGPPAVSETSQLNPAGEPPTVDYVPAIGMIPGYRLGIEIGRGGMGVVYRATRLSDGASVAIKTIKPATDIDPRQIDRFLREAAILEKLQHPNIVAFLEAGEREGLIYLAMELVNGPNAQEVLQEKGPMAVAMAVQVICHILAALGYAHSLGFVHRDIKPRNILLGEINGRPMVKLGDFGLARMYQSSQLSGLTLLGEVGGTPAFMAPEQATHFRDARPSSDQFAAAASLYRLLTGAYIYDLPKSTAQQFVHIVTATPVPILSRNPALPTELATIIHRALSREPSDRFPNVAAFRKALLPFA